MSWGFKLGCVLNATSKECSMFKRLWNWAWTENDYGQVLDCNNMISLVLTPVFWHIIYKICFDFDSYTRPLITTRQIAQHDDPVKSIEADALWHTNLLFSEHFIDTSKINQKTDQLVSLNTTAIGSKISPLRIPGLTKIKAFHRLSESRLAVIPSIGSCLHIFKRSLSGLEIESVIGSCTTFGFRDGPDPLF